MMLNNDLRIALLIDGDNAQPALIEPILKKLTEYGTCDIRRVYGNWLAQNMSNSGWPAMEKTHGIQLIQQTSYVTGKNSTDIAITIDAMDILQTSKIDAFCLVSSDSDFTPLVVRLKDKGKTVIVAGRSNTSLALKNVASQFIEMDTLKGATKTAAKATPETVTKPVVKPTLPKTPQQPKAPPEPKKVAQSTNLSETIPDARKLLKIAYAQSTHDNGWVSFGTLKSTLQLVNPLIRIDNRVLRHLLSQHIDMFETKVQVTDEREVINHVKLKGQK